MSQQVQTVRNPPPRMLTRTESLHSLNHWKTSFRTYYRRDSYFKAFLLPNATWNNLTADNYGQVADMNGTTTTRTAQDKGEDLKDFLNTLAGYLPFPYLTEKIVDGSTRLQDVWDTIYDHYGINITSESLLDYVTVTISDGETYRQFFDRLLSHARLHLPKANVTVEGINTGATGEQMTVGLMNFVALDWLRKINPQLVNIIKTEYSRELRENVQLSELVPRISTNIDALLTRHDIVGGIDSVNIDAEQTVDGINRVKFNNSKKKGKQAKQTERRTGGGRIFCPECHYLSKKLKLDINFAHFPAQCPRSRAAVQLLLAEEASVTESEADDDIITGKIEINENNVLNPHCQMNPDSPSLGEEVVVVEPKSNTDALVNDITINYASFYQKVLSLQNAHSNVRKEHSPQLRTLIGNVIADSIIDEGSELNCICSSIAARCQLKFTPVKINAMAAGSNSMKLLGVIPSDIVLKVQDSKSAVQIILKHAVVVKNLGPNILIGEPGKMDNNIITLP